MGYLDTVRGALSLQWVSLDYFTKGWDFFLKEEYFNIMILGSIMWVIDMLRGNEMSCRLLHLAMVVLVRRVLAGGICLSTKRLDGQTVVITGCNVGIGMETARDLSQRGAKIIMACRNTTVAEKVAADIKRETGGELVVMKLDLSSLVSVRTFAKDLANKVQEIHILINNAGVMMCPYMKTEDGFELQMGTNHLGHFLLTVLLLPLINKGHAARIVNVSSLAHCRGVIPFDDMTYEGGYNKVVAYGNSKVANILFTRQLAKRLKGSNIQVFSLHPGAVKTNLARHVMNDWANTFSQAFLKTSREGAQTSLYCALEATQQEPHYFSDCCPGYTAAAARDDDVAERLWQVSEKLVGLSS